MITYCEKCESNIDTDKPCKHVIYQKPITITTPATKPLDEAVQNTVDYLYTIKGDCSDELYQAIATLRQLINEEFVPNGKSVSSQFIYDIIAPTLTNAEKQARIDELSQVSYIGGTLANKNQDILDRIQELENL